MLVAIPRGFNDFFNYYLRFLSTLGQTGKLPVFWCQGGALYLLVINQPDMTLQRVHHDVLNFCSLNCSD